MQRWRRLASRFAARFLVRLSVQLAVGRSCHLRVRICQHDAARSFINTNMTVGESVWPHSHAAQAPGQGLLEAGRRVEPRLTVQYGQLGTPGGCSGTLLHEMCCPCCSSVGLAPCILRRASTGGGTGQELCTKRPRRRAVGRGKPAKFLTHRVRLHLCCSAPMLVYRWL